MPLVELRGRWLLGAVTALTSLGFFLIGFDNGLMGGLVTGPAFNKTFDNPDPDAVGNIVSLFEIGCFFGSVLSSIWGQRLGRLKSIAWGIVIMIVGAVLQATAYGQTHMIIARIVSGVGLGIINSTTPVLQAEFSPQATRGIFVCAQLSTLNFGILLVYWIDYAFSTNGSDSSVNWRVPVILQCVFLVPMGLLLFIIPESPRWLAQQGRDSESMEVLQRLYGKDEARVKRTYDDIVANIESENAAMATKRGVKGLWQEDEIHSRRRLLIACSVQAFQQLGGINAIIYYSGTIFQDSVGLSPHNASLMSGFLQTWFFLASFIPWFLIDRIGRRKLLLSMIFVMFAVLVAQAALTYQIQFKTAAQHAAGIAATLMLFLYEGAFTVGFQATVWVYPSEILPLAIRQRGSSISTACNWIINFAVVKFTPPAIANIGWKTYIIFAVFNLCFLPVIYLTYPETMGLRLEHVDGLFLNHPSGMKGLGRFADREVRNASLRTASLAEAGEGVNGVNGVRKREQGAGAGGTAAEGSSDGRQPSRGSSRKVGAVEQHVEMPEGGERR